MDFVPLWLQDLAVLIAIPAAVELGFRLHALKERRKGSASPSTGETEWGQISAASMSILGLLLAFTVSMAVGHYESRRRLVVEEANAISTTYLRAQLFADPGRQRLSSLLSTYAEDRRRIADVGDLRPIIDRAEAVIDDDQHLLWNATSDAVRQPGDGA